MYLEAHGRELSFGFADTTTTTTTTNNNNNTTTKNNNNTNTDNILRSTDES